MKERRVRKGVEDDLTEAADFYDARQPGLGTRFLAAAGATLRRIEENPLQFRTVYEDYRRALFPRPFPYQIFFRVQGKYVDIYAILHTARAPDTWRSRR